MEEEKNKDFGRYDEKLIGLPKNFKINLSESEIRLVKKYGTFLINEGSMFKGNTINIKRNKQ